MKKIILILGTLMIVGITNAQIPPNPQPRQGCALFNFYVNLPAMPVFTVHSNVPSNITLPMVGDWSGATITVKAPTVYPANWALCETYCDNFSVPATTYPHINTTWYLKPGHASAQAYYTVTLTKTGCPTDEEPIRYVLILP